MANRRDSNSLPTVSQLIENPVRADPKRVQASEFSAQRVADKRVALEQGKRILDRIDQRPAQVEQIEPGSPGEDESRQRSVGGLSALGKLASKLGKSDRLPPLDLGEPLLQRGEGIGI